MDLSSGLLVAGRADDDRAGLYRFTAQDHGWSGDLIVEVSDLAAMCWHPTLPIVYGVCGEGDGTLFAWDLGGAIARTMQVERTGGTIPCDVSIDPTGVLLIVTNFGKSSLDPGNVVTWPIDARGRLGTRQMISGSVARGFANPHQAVFTGTEILIPDLGADAIHVFGFVPTEGRELVARQALAVPHGTGPRHLVPVGNAFVVSGELSSEFIKVDGLSNKSIAVSSTRRTGAATTRSERNYPGDIKVSASGRHAYIANRGYDTIACFELDREGTPGFVAEVAVSAWPQHLLIADEGVVVASWDASTVSLVLLRDGVPVEVVHLFDCPGAAWLLPGRVFVASGAAP